MKASTHRKYGPPEVIEIKEVEKPVPNDKEVLIRIRATTVTAVDSIFRKGNQFFARMATGIFSPKKPVLGTELAGEIESTGKEVTLFKTGDQVFGDSTEQGTHAEYICLPENGVLAKKPDNLSDEEATAVPYGALTALPFLRDNGKIQSGHKILIIGASGSVGTFAVQLARYYGAEVTGLCSTSNEELVKSLGANKVIDYKKEDFTKSGLSWDIIFDTVGKSSFSQCKKLLAPEGVFLTTYISTSILLQMLMTSVTGKKKAVIAFTGLRPTEERTKDLLFIRELLMMGKLKPVIDKKYPFDQIEEAHRYVDQGHKKGNVVILM